MAKKITQLEFIDRMRSLYGDRFDLDEVEYVSAVIPVTLECKIHGHFGRKPTELFKGKSCQHCAWQATADSQRLSQSEFERRIRELFGDRYRLEKAVYQSTGEKVTLICPDHGEFKKTPNHLFTKKKGCPECNRTEQGEARRKYTRDDMQSLAKGRGGEFLSKSYTIVRKSYQWRCRNNHEFKLAAADALSGRWCRECSSGLYERICRAYFEAAFKSRFPNRRDIDWLVSPEGTHLELDGYAESLGVAFEHQGGHHYRGTKAADFFSDAKYDDLKAQLCVDNQVKLVVIPELTTRTKLEKLPEFLESECARLNVKPLVAFTDVSPDWVAAYAPDELELLRAYGHDLGYQLESPAYFGATYRYEWSCLERGHKRSAEKYRLKRSVCPQCDMERKGQAGIIDGEYLKTATAAAEKFGLSAQAIQRRIREFGDTLEEAVGEVQRANAVTYEYEGQHYPTKIALCQALGLNAKSIDQYCRNQNSGFMAAVETFIQRRASLNIMGIQFDDKQTVYAHFNVSEMRVMKYQEDNPSALLAETIEALAIPYNGKYYATEKALCEDLGLSYNAFINRKRRTSDSRDGIIAKLLAKAK